MLFFEILIAGCVTLLATLGVGWVMRRLVANELTSLFLAMGLRALFAIALAVFLSLSELPHRGALILTVGAAYFAAVVGEGCQRFRRAERG